MIFGRSSLAIILTVTALSLSGCSEVQTTSGADYAERHKADMKNSVDDAAFKAKLMDAINVEPTLKFPARIGVARIEAGKLVNLPPQEKELWMNTSTSLGNSYGEFVAVNPLVATMAAGADDASLSTIQKVRLGAARQHVDAVIMYEAYANEKQEGDFIVNLVSGLTIIGAALLPTVAVETEAFSSAIMVDVATGYPYVMTDAVVKKQDMQTLNALRRETRLMSDEAKLQAVKKLSDKIEANFCELKTKLGK